MRPTQDTEVCQYCGERGCSRRFANSGHGFPPEWVMDCMQRQLNKQARELWGLRRDVARLLEKENTND